MGERGETAADRADQGSGPAGVVSAAAGATLRGALWGARTGARTYVWGLRRVAAAAREPELVDEMARGLIGQARRVLGVEEIAERVRLLPNQEQSNGTVAESAETNGSGATRERLRVLGAELLARSTDLTTPDEPGHPAYERILGSMAPDEARILRLLATAGPRAAVDVRTWRPLDMGSELLAPGVTMIGQQAGLRFPDRVPAYLNNLERLGLIWFSRESVSDASDYQVLEAQPHVTGPMAEVGRARTIRRSIRLTPFGDDFCRVCLPVK